MMAKSVCDEGDYVGWNCLRRLEKGAGMRHSWLAGIAIFAACLTGARADDSELAVRRKIESEANNALRSGNVEKLEAMASEFRVKRSRTPSGVWKLTYFYRGIESAVTADNRDDPNPGKAPLATADAWQRAYPNSPSAKYAKGAILAKRAWLIRGHGFAGSVPEAAWQPFREGMEAARVYLESVKSVASADPAWYCEMANIAKAQSWPVDRFEAFATEVLERHPYYYQALGCTAEYWSPRWGNASAKAVESFADRAVEKTRKEDGSSVFARTYWSISSNEVDPALFGTNLSAWPKVRQGFKDLIERYPDPWNINHFARFACLARDTRQFNELASRIGSTPMQEVWGSTLYQRCVAAAAEIRPGPR